MDRQGGPRVRLAKDHWGAAAAVRCARAGQRTAVTSGTKRDQAIARPTVAWQLVAQCRQAEAPCPLPAGSPRVGAPLVPHQALAISASMVLELLSFVAAPKGAP